MRRTCLTRFLSSLLALLALAMIQGPYARAAKRFPARKSCQSQSGQTYALGMVAYAERSTRLTVVAFRTYAEDPPVPAGIDDPEGTCHDIVIQVERILVNGGPMKFYLNRARSVMDFSMTEGAPKFVTSGGIDGLHPSGFYYRERSYEFVYGANSRSILEIRPSSPPSSRPAAASPGGPGQQTNSTILDAISPEEKDRPPTPGGPRPNPYPELQRSAWVVAARDIRAQSAQIRPDEKGEDRLSGSTREVRIVRAGQVGQIESVSEREVAVRFYLGSRVDAFGQFKNNLRRIWASEDPSANVRDGTSEFYSNKLSDTLIVPLSAIVDIHDYLDKAATDRTGGNDHDDAKYDAQRLWKYLDPY